MSGEHVPRLRPVELVALRQQGKDLYLLRDPQGIAPEPLVLSQASAALLQFLDGEHSLADIQLALTRVGGQIVPLEPLRAFVDTLDKALYLDSPRFAEHRRAFAESYAALATRPARFAGEAYPQSALELSDYLGKLFSKVTADASPAVPNPPAVLAAPHIDPARGARLYAHAYAEVWGGQYDRIIILGVCHAQADAPFILTTKDYATPLGTARVDQDFLTGLVGGLDWNPLDQQELHLAEHSIEFQLIMLQYALARGAKIDVLPPILPILCAFSPADFCEAQSGGITTDRRTGEFLSRLGSLIRNDEARTLVAAGIDLAHVGPRFGGAQKLTETALSQLETRDLATLDLVTAGKRDSFVRELLDEADARNICGFGAVYSFLTLLPGLRGRVLAYDQAVDPDLGGAVTFAAMRFNVAEEET